MIHFEPRRKASIYASFVALFIVTAYNFLRTGLDFQWEESIKTVGFSLFILNFPLIFIETYSIKKTIKILQDEYTILFLSLISVCILGLLSIKLGYFFVVTGLLSFSWNLFFYLKTIKWQEIISIPFVLIISIWISITVWKGDYIHPLLLERLAFNDQIHIDTIYHISLAQMIKTYLIPSTGLNGLPFTNYHFGSHFVFACLSKTLNTHLFTFYQLSFPAIFLPLFIKSVSGIPIVYAERDSGGTLYKFGFWFWGILCAALIGIFPLFGMLNKAAMETPAILASESYCISMLFFFMIINIVLFNYYFEKKGLSFNIPTLVLILAMVLLLGLTKNSTLCILNVIVFYLFFRLQLFKQRTLLFFYGLLVLISIICLWITIDKKTGDGTFELFHFYKTYIKLSISQFIYICYFWSILLIALCTLIIFLNKKNNSSEQNQFYRTLLETTILVCLAGVCPGLLLNIAGGSAGYFMDIQIWFSIAFSLAVLPKAIQLTSDSIKKINKHYNTIIAGVFIIIAFNSGMVTQSNFGKAFHLFVNNTLEDKIEICGESLPAQELTYLEKLNMYVNMNSKLIPGLSKNQNYNILSQLYRMDTLPISEKSKTMLTFGDISALSQKYPCYKYPFLFPALTGMALKNGFIFEDCFGKYYGFEYYKREDLKTKHNLPDPCKDLMIEIRSEKIEVHPL